MQSVHVSMLDEADERRGSATAWTVGLVVTAFVLFQIWFSWIGFIQSDDESYAFAAQGWTEHGLYLAQTHWGLRHLIVLPTAMFFKLFGRNEWTLEATSIVYTFALLALVYACAARDKGRATGVLAAVLLVSVPMISVSFSQLYTDVPEAFFVLASLLAFHKGWETDRPSVFFLSGVLAGMAAITRETTICLGVFYFILFVTGYKGNRLVYVWMALGGLLIVGADTLALWLASGDPLYRLHVSFHQVVDANNMAGLIETNDTTSGLDRAGVLGAPRWIKPLLMMFVNQQIGPICWLGVPAAIAISLAPRRSELELPKLMALLALVWFVCTAYLLYRSLYLIPRYQIVTVSALAICLAVWVANARTFLTRSFYTLSLLAIIVGGVLLTGMSDRNFLFSERQLVTIAHENPGKIWTDPATLRGAQWLLNAAGDDMHVAAGEPVAGGLYVFNKKPRRDFPENWPLKTVPANWIVVKTYTEPQRPLVTALESAGVFEKLPEILKRKLAPEPRTTLLLRVPGTVR